MAKTNQAAETRTVRDFERVALRDYGDLIITQGDEETLTIEAHPDVLGKIRSEVRDGTLTLQIGKDWLERIVSGLWSFRRRRVTYRLHVTTLRGLRMSGAFDMRAERLETDSLELTGNGAGEIHIGALTADSLTVEIGGRGEVDVAGRVREQTVKISGSGEYEAAQLESQTAHVRITGSGEADVWVHDTLDVSIAGYGHVRYRGAPAVSQSISGAGSVKRWTDDDD